MGVKNEPLSGPPERAEGLEVGSLGEAYRKDRKGYRGCERLEMGDKGLRVQSPFCRQERSHWKLLEGKQEQVFKLSPELPSVTCFCLLPSLPAVSPSPQLPTQPELRA